ncbi:MAG TPA: hypothetical protein VGF45_18390 [Polyangia bacterium]
MKLSIVVLAAPWRARVAAAVGVGLLKGVFLAIVLVDAVHAGTTRFWRQTTARDFEEGEATASAVLATGEVVPFMRATRLPLEAGFVYAGALSADGKTAFFGSGDQGRIFSVAVGPKGLPAGKRLAEVPAPWVTSLAVRGDGSLLAGSTPGGRVFILDPAKGEPKVFAKLAGDHIWALAHDAASGTTYVGTGAPGKVFALARDGKGADKPLWDSGDKQVVALVRERGGTLLAGTASEAIVYRIKGNGQAEAVHDFDADEVRAMLRVGDATYIAVNDFLGDSDTSTFSSTPAATPPAPRGTSVTPAAGAPPAIGSGTRPGGRSVRARAAVYRLADAGGIEQVFTLADGYLTSLASDGKDGVFAASGSQGKVYRLLADRSSMLAADLSERQALVVLPVSTGFLVGTGDVGGVYDLRTAGAGQATYLSKVFDGEVASQWGQLRFTGVGKLGFETRSGNTAKPDRSWTGWKTVGSIRHDGWEGEGKIASPPARYLQYRASFGPGTPTLKEVSLAYLPQNQRARVVEVTTSDATPAPTFSLTPAPTPPPVTARTHSPTIRLRFRVENPDADPLLYRLWYRKEKDTVWQALGGPEPLTRAEYDWNTDAVADGRYLVRVWATDEKANPGERALDHTFVSPPFLVDNSRPEVIDLKQKGPVISGRARDAGSIVTAIDYAIDGEDWRPASPADGLCDSKLEGFAFRLADTVGKGPHVVNVRATDAADNIGTARLEIKVE